MEKRLYRSRTDKYVAGVCSGVAEYFNIDPTIVRIVFAIIALSSLGTALIAYLIAAIVIPEQPKDYVPETNGESKGEGFTFENKNSRQTLGIVLVGVGALILMSRVVNWFDSGMILAVGVIALGAFLVFRRNEE